MTTCPGTFCQVLSFIWRNGHHHENRNALKYWGKIVLGLSDNISMEILRKCVRKLTICHFSRYFQTSCLLMPYYSSRAYMLYELLPIWYNTLYDNLSWYVLSSFKLHMEKRTSPWEPQCFKILGKNSLRSLW